MKFKEYGAKNPEMLVFLHGGGVGGWMWDKQIEYFSANYHCLVPEILQLDNKDAKKFTINKTVDDLIQLIESAGPNKPVSIVGFSIGAQIALSALSKRPNMFSSAMINSALVRPVPFARILTKIMLPALPLTKNRTFSDIQATSMYIEKEYLDTYYQSNKNISSRLFADTMVENMTYTIPSLFPDSTSNILVTVGEKEIRSIKSSMTDIVDSNPNTHFLVVPNIGHGFPLAAPTLFNETLERLLESTKNK